MKRFPSFFCPSQATRVGGGVGRGAGKGKQGGPGVGTGQWEFGVPLSAIWPKSMRADRWEKDR